MYKLGVGNELVPILDPLPNVQRRQDLPSVFALNGAVYVADVAKFRAERSFVTSDTVGYVMPTERSIDVDTQADFDAFRMIVEDAHA